MPNPSVKTQVSLLERRVAELEQRLVRLTALHRVAQSIGKSPNASRVFVELARELGAALPRVYEVSVSEWDRRRGVIRDIFEFKPQQNRRVAVPGFEFELGALPELHALLRAGRGSLVSLRNGQDTSPAQVAYMKRFGWYSLLQAPLSAGGRTLGVIEIADIDETRPWDPHEIEFCETLASQAAVTLQQAQLFERIRHMADHDPLTGLANPRVFHRKAAAAERAARRHKTPLGVLVIDIDDFKQLQRRARSCPWRSGAARGSLDHAPPCSRGGHRGTTRRRRACAAAAAHQRGGCQLDRRPARACARAGGHPRVDRPGGLAEHRLLHGREPRRVRRPGASPRQASGQAADRTRGLTRRAGPRRTPRAYER